MQQENISMDGDLKTSNTFKIVLLDVTSEMSNLFKRHRSTETQVSQFYDEDECETYIRHQKDEEIILVIKSSSTLKMLSKFHSLKAVKAIYVHSNTDDCLGKEKMDFPKVRYVDMRSGTDELIYRIDHGERRRNYWLTPLVYDQLQLNQSTDAESSSTEINGEFLHSQILLDSLLTMNPTKIDRASEIAYFREKYSGNTAVLAQIDEFESNYSASTALQWYTKESFFYATLNKAFRLRDIDALYAMRRFIRDLRDQLVEQQGASISFSQVYRAQLIAKSEFEDFEIGQLISMNSFISTTKSEHHARFLLEGARLNSETLPLLFEIRISADVSGTKPFADIANKSEFANECEVLFMPGSIFRVTNLVPNADGISVINLVLCGDDDHDLKELFEYMRKDIPPDSLPFGFGICLANSGKLEQAERFFRKVLSEMNDDDPLIMDIYHQLGNVLDDMGKFEESFQCYQKALEKKLQVFSSKDPRIANTYTCYGAAYMRKKDFDHALEFYGKALEIYKQAYGEEDRDVAMCLDNMADVKMSQKDFHESVRLHKQALQIWIATLPENHPDIARAHAGVAEALLELGSGEEALEHYQKALAIAESSLPPKHQDLPYLYDGLGKLYLVNKNYDAAKEYSETSLAIKKCLYSSDHQAFVDSYHNLGLICKGKGDFQQALALLERALTIQNKHFPEDDDVSVRLRNDLATTRLALERLTQ